MITRHFQRPSHIDEPHDVISPCNVKIALLNRFHHTYQPNPLENLLIIDQVVCDPLFPSFMYGRKFALAETLISIITNELIRHRGTMEIPQRPAEASISDAYRAICKDSQTCNTELLGWSWLYYRYVRVDLDIQQNRFCEIACVDTRTIRRYQDKAIMRLAEIIIDKEWRARRPRIADV